LGFSWFSDPGDHHNDTATQRDTTLADATSMFCDEPIPDWHAEVGKVAEVRWGKAGE